MKQALNRIFHIVKHRGHGGGGLQRTHATVWRDWYIMIGGVALALIAYCSVGAYIFLVTIQHVETNDSDTQPYQPPTSKEVMLKTASTLQERTELFMSLRSTPSNAPGLGNVPSEESTLVPEDLIEDAAGDGMDEVVGEEPVPVE